MNVSCLIVASPTIDERPKIVIPQCHYEVIKRDVLDKAEVELRRRLRFRTMP